MKKLVTISILTAAMAASAAFAMPSFGGGKDSNKRDNNGVKTVYVKKDLLTQNQQQKVAGTLFRLNNIIADNSGVSLKSVYVAKNNNGMWKLVAKHDGEAKKISADDLALVAKNANDNAKEKLCASSRDVIQCAMIDSQSRDSYVAVQVTQEKDQLILEQVKPQPELSNKIKMSNHRGLTPIQAAQSDNNDNDKKSRR